MANALDVYLGTDHAGVLQQDEHKQLAFSYTQKWLADPGNKPISLSLPLQPQAFDDLSTRIWFANLLPEGRIREAVAKRHGINRNNEFAMLAAIGRDCAGAVSIWPQGEFTKRATAKEQISNAELAQIIQTRKLPLLVAGTNDIRLSLAGAQEKLPLIYDRSRFYLTQGEMPSTHILKPAIDDLLQSVHNEVFCMQLASACGLNTAAASIVKLNEIVEVALIERFDRKQKNKKTVRIHQEDFCQALGMHPDAKYQSEGGPDLARCAQAIRQWSIKPGHDLKVFIDWVIFNVFIGNCDAHAKNISFTYTPKGPVLAPFYDLICTRVYEDLNNKLAMKVGGEGRINWLQARHWQRFAEELEIKPNLIFDRLDFINKKITSTYGEVAEQFGELQIITKIIKHVERVSDRL